LRFLPDNTFESCTSITDLVLPNTVTNIGSQAFLSCANLARLTIPASVIGIGLAFGNTYGLVQINVAADNPAFSGIDGVLFDKIQATLIQYPRAKAGSSYVIPDSVRHLAPHAFYGVPNLTRIYAGPSLASIEGAAFESNPGLVGIYFRGDAPTLTGSYVFYGDGNLTVYYLPGRAGWTSTLQATPTAPWFLPYPVILSSDPGFGIHTNRFCFTISWATNATVVVNASADLSKTNWEPVQTLPLVNGAARFADAYWTNYPARFYSVGAQ
ncbi:MAG TPA: leucine-rich repeat domain-containing protein, partial [Verrucomicrobiae bacterium]|nr:leucine-rich repeat domain-containing protein [Verrucomicrobiae bacterium]